MTIEPLPKPQSFPTLLAAYSIATNLSSVMTNAATACNNHMEHYGFLGNASNNRLWCLRTKQPTVSVRYRPYQFPCQRRKTSYEPYLYPILMPCCRSDGNQKKMRKTVYSNYEEKKLYIHEVGAGNSNRVSHRVVGSRSTNSLNCDSNWTVHKIMLDWKFYRNITETVTCWKIYSVSSTCVKQ